MKRHLPLLAVLLVLTAVIAGCGSDESREDANDVGNGNVEKSSPAVIAFNNHFPNVEIKCDGFGDLLLVITHDDNKDPAITVLPGHPRCAGISYRDLIERGEQPDLGWEPPTDPNVYPTHAAVVP